MESRSFRNRTNFAQRSLATRFALLWAFTGEQEKAAAGGIGTTAPNRRNEENFDPGRQSWLHEVSGGGSNDDYRRLEFYASPRSRSNIRPWPSARFFAEWNPEARRR